MNVKAAQGDRPLSLVYADEGELLLGWEGWCVLSVFLVWAIDRVGSVRVSCLYMKGSHH